MKAYLDCTHCPPNGDLHDTTSTAGLTGQVLLVLLCYLVMALSIAGVSLVLG